MCLARLTSLGEGVARLLISLRFPTARKAFGERPMASLHLLFAAALLPGAAAAWEVCPATRSCLDGGAWLVAAHWQNGIAAYPALARIDGAGVLAVETRGAAKEILVSRGASLKLSVGGTLRIGPTQCDETQTVQVEPTATADRQCEDNVVCTADEFQLWPRTPYEDRVCHPLTVCGEGQYEIEAKTDTSDRHCGTHASCYWPQQFESRAPTPTSDRECSAVQMCTHRTSAKRKRQCGVRSAPRMQRRPAFSFSTRWTRS